MCVPASLLRVKFLDVGQGDAAVVLLPTPPRRAIVVDAFDGKRVVRVLEEEAIEDIVVFLSHSDRDHVNGILYLLDNFQGAVRAIFYHRDRIVYEVGKQYRSYLTALCDARKRVEDPIADNFYVGLNEQPRFNTLFPKDVFVEVVHPEFSDQTALLTTSTNDVSGVVRIGMRLADGTSHAALLTGDVQLTGISLLLARSAKRKIDLGADVLKYPHHGAWPTSHKGIAGLGDVARASMADLLGAVNPVVVVLSVGFSNRSSHVRKEVFAAFRAHAENHRLDRVMCTQFTVTCNPDGNTALVERQCCGDIEMRIGSTLAGGVELLPERAVHTAHIRRCVGSSRVGCLIPPNQ